VPGNRGVDQAHTDRGADPAWHRDRQIPQRTMPPVARRQSRPFRLATRSGRCRC